jgi:hypothetical protein
MRKKTNNKKIPQKTIKKLHGVNSNLKLKYIYNLCVTPFLVIGVPFLVAY